MQLFAGELTNQNREYYKVNDNIIYFPYGKVRQDFIDQLTMHINQWNNKSDKQHIALKAFFALLAVGLQKPGLKSKAKDHKEYLKSRLLLWENGEIDMSFAE